MRRTFLYYIPNRSCITIMAGNPLLNNASKRLKTLRCMKLCRPTADIMMRHENQEFISRNKSSALPRIVHCIVGRRWPPVHCPKDKRPSCHQWRILCGLQPRSRRLAPAHLIDGISSVCRNGEIKTERHRVSRDLAVGRVVLPGCAAWWSLMRFGMNLPRDPPANGNSYKWEKQHIFMIIAHVYRY
jgi:hypothetical protein